MPHMPFLDHIDPGQGGSAMVIPELPAWTSFRAAEKYPCKQCSAVFGTYVALAHRARGFAASPRGIRLINRTCGTAMAGAAVLVATK